MAAVNANIHGMDRARNRVTKLRAGLSRRRSRTEFNRRAHGAYAIAAIVHTPSPLRTQDPSHLVENRTGNLLNSFRAYFASPNILRLNWGAPYASYPNEDGFSKGYVDRTVQDGNMRLRDYIRKEERASARRALRAAAAGGS